MTDAAYPDLSAGDLRPLPGGFSGETFLARLPDEGEVVVRIYGRDPHRVAVDAALLHLLRGLLPVPSVVEMRRPEQGSPGVLVTERLAGRRLDLAVDEATEVDWTTLGHSLGAVLTTLSAIPQLRAGLFRDADLVPDAGMMAHDLTEWTYQHRDVGLLATWSPADRRALFGLVDAAQDLTDAAEGRVVLVHSDLNLKNLLVDPSSWQVTGVLDWEFAHAGSPHADLGNLTRFEREPALLTALRDTLLDGPGVAGDRLRCARAIDLWATIELAGRENVTTVSRLAERLLSAQAREGDLCAWPFPGDRVSIAAARVGAAATEPVS